MSLFLKLSSFLLLLLLSSCTVNPPTPKVVKNIFSSSTLPLDSLQMPDGFKIHVYAENVVNARSMALSPNGTLFVGTRKKSVYALVDTDGDFQVDKQYTIADDLNMPNGVAFRDGDLYVAEVSRILKYEDIEQHLENPPKPVVLNDKYPTESHHGWKFISFGPDGKLYVPVGAPCNICESEDEIFATITRINADGNGREIVHRGIRNTVGFTWHPDTKEMWFTDNGRDMMGDNKPACELNHAPQDGMHFGYPYCHQGDLADPEFGEKRACSEFTAPAQKLGPHVAPLGIEFCESKMFPATYTKQLLFAEHGSWNRSEKIGYRIMMATLDGNKVTSYKPFADGWLSPDKKDVWGRPVDLEFLPDGSMLVSDDYADVVYRIYYEK